MALFRRKNPLPAAIKPKVFRIKLGWRGMLGLVAVCGCLFLWMFLLGLWAGQTILLPPRTAPTADVSPPTSAGTGTENGAPQRPQ